MTRSKAWWSFLAVALVACSGDDSATGGSDDGGKAALDGTLYDSAPSAGATGATPEDASSDAGATQGAGSCSALATSACRMCCASSYDAGFASFQKLALACACDPGVCGALDAGGADASGEDAGEDAGLLGTGACAVTCQTSTESTTACTSCLQAALGSEQAPGPCGATVVGQCITDPTCGPFVECVESCP